MKGYLINLCQEFFSCFMISLRNNHKVLWSLLFIRRENHLWLDWMENGGIMLSRMLVPWSHDALKTWRCNVEMPDFWELNGFGSDISSYWNMKYLVISMEMQFVILYDCNDSSMNCLWSCYHYFQLYDIRSMKELESFRGHRKDVTG